MVSEFIDMVRNMRGRRKDFADRYQLIGETDIDKTYEIPKSFVSYRKPRRLAVEQREAAREGINFINRGETY